MNIDKAYRKLLKYIERKYPSDNVQWGADVESDSTYSMRNISEGTQRVISICYDTLKITDIKQNWTRI